MKIHFLMWRRQSKLNCIHRSGFLQVANEFSSIMKGRKLVYWSCLFALKHFDSVSLLLLRHFKTLLWPLLYWPLTRCGTLTRTIIIIYCCLVVELMFLVCWMLHSEPHLRATVKDVLSYKWLNQKVDVNAYDYDTIFGEFEFQVGYHLYWSLQSTKTSCLSS